MVPAEASFCIHCMQTSLTTAQISAAMASLGEIQQVLSLLAS